MITPSILFNKHTTITLLTLLTLCACSSLPGNENRTPSYALTHTETTTLAKSIQAKRKEDGMAASASGMILLTEGVDAFIARAAIARMAEQSLDVQYYLFHSDICGTLLTHELVMAADRGVRVRVLLDDMDTSGKDETLARINAHPNIEMRVFNPFIRGKSRTGQFVSRFGSVTRRMHNKAMIADNQIAIIGGRNIGDEYFGANPEVAFGDLDVTVSTPGAQKVSTAFDLYWNCELSYPVDLLVDHQPTEQQLEQALLELSEFV
ncbi:MAG: phospholipase D-like domain-containing protein, partial [Pseudomonadales bacterium]|nr:phospholipase D-like domain-containing protein [Pseudomonadales bacterium]